MLVSGQLELQSDQRQQMINLRQHFLQSLADCHKCREASPGHAAGGPTNYTLSAAVPEPYWNVHNLSVSLWVGMVTCLEVYNTQGCQSIIKLCAHLKTCLAGLQGTQKVRQLTALWVQTPRHM